MRHASLTRRLVAGTVGLMVGTAAAVALATPATATDHDGQTDRFGKVAGLSGTAECDEETGQWTVTWEVSNPSPFVQATITELSSEVDGFVVDDVVDPQDSLTGTQTFDSATEEATLTVTLKWAWQGWKGKWHDTESTATEPVTIGQCGEPDEGEEEPPEGGFVESEFDCDTFTLSITNDDEEAVTLTVVPSEGDSVEVTVEGGETSEAITFPSSEGLVVDVQLVEGESALEDGPIEITSQEWDALGCEDDDGEGGELPATGASTGMIALGAVLLLALGGGLFLVARRRRVSFSA